MVGDIVLREETPTVEGSDDVSDLYRPCEWTSSRST
jgi:hypothetical protein